MEINEIALNNQNFITLIQLVDGQRLAGIIERTIEDSQTEITLLYPVIVHEVPIQSKLSPQAIEMETRIKLLFGIPKTLFVNKKNILYIYVIYNQNLLSVYKNMYKEVLNLEKDNKGKMN